MAQTFNPGVPLAEYRRHNAGVRLTCLDCMHCRDLPLEPVIARLAARGVGGAHTGYQGTADPAPPHAPCLNHGSTCSTSHVALLWRPTRRLPHEPLSDAGRVLALAATNANAASCRDPKTGKFMKCPPAAASNHCRDKVTKRFAKCSAANVEPVPVEAK